MNNLLYQGELILNENKDNEWKKKVYVAPPTKICIKSSVVLTS